MINIMLSLEYSIIILLIYILIRSTAKKEFGGDEKNIGTIIIIFGFGIFLYIYINTILGIIVIFGGLTLILIPEKGEKNKLKEI